MGLQRHTCKADKEGKQLKITSFAKSNVPEAVKPALTNTIAHTCGQDLRPALLGTR